MRQKKTEEIVLAIHNFLQSSGRLERTWSWMMERNMVHDTLVSVLFHRVMQIMLLRYTEKKQLRCQQQPFSPVTDSLLSYWFYPNGLKDSCFDNNKSEIEHVSIGDGTPTAP